MITIDLHHTHERPPGRYQTTTRWQKADRGTVDAAAALIDMTTAAFIRAVAHQAAEQVLAETIGVKLRD